MSAIGSVVLQLFQTSSAQDPLTSIVFGGGRTSVSSATSIAALRLAQTNEDKEVAAKANDPKVRRELEAFFKAVRDAESPQDLLDNPTARTVLLTANGLGEFVNAPGMAKKALLADLSDTTSLPYTLRTSNPAWLGTAQAYDFRNQGLGVLRTDDMLVAVADAYAQVRWREDLDARAPGLSNALSFVKNASTFTSALQILGTGYAREVLTTAVGLPQEMARQSLQTQIREIEDRVDIARLQDQRYVEDMARRYLIAIAGDGVGGFASTSA